MEEFISKTDLGWGFMKIHFLVFEVAGGAVVVGHHLTRI